MKIIDKLYSLKAKHWGETFSLEEQQEAISVLEQGKIIFLPELSLDCRSIAKDWMSPNILGKKSKNISFNPNNGTLKGVCFKMAESLRDDDHANNNSDCSNFSDVPDHSRHSALSKFLFNFSSKSRSLIEALIPHYKTSLMSGRTSFRPAEIKGRKTSILKDDTRLHVDSFSATPTQGKRILRVFTNINPNQETRLWHVGEPFEEVVHYFKKQFKKPFFLSRALLYKLGMTKSYRSLYDHYMLQLHNQMKLNDAYQNSVSKTEIHFPSGSSWIVMTDHVSHAAISGQFVLEQTFYLPVSGMQYPELSPLKVLEKTLSQRLLD